MTENLFPFILRILLNLFYLNAYFLTCYLRPAPQTPQDRASWMGKVFAIRLVPEGRADTVLSTRRPGDRRRKIDPNGIRANRASGAQHRGGRAARNRSWTAPESGGPP